MAMPIPENPAELNQPAMMKGYKASWVDLLQGWIDRLPGVSHWYYLVLGLVVLLLRMGVMVIEGNAGSRPFLFSHAFLIFITVFHLVLMHYLDRRAGTALSKLTPVLEASEETYDKLKYCLTNMPFWPTLLVGLVGMAFGILVSEFAGKPITIVQLEQISPSEGRFVYWGYIITFFVWAAFLYHTVHQLSVINLIYTKFTRINLFYMRPLFAFSVISAITAVAIIIGPYAWFGLNPGSLDHPVSISILIGISALSLVTFLWPLVGVHRLLAEEKGQLSDQNSLRLEASIKRLHDSLDGDEEEEMTKANLAISSLQNEHHALDGIPTWPWAPETPRLLITAIALPILLWLVQYILQSFLK